MITKKMIKQIISMIKKKYEILQIILRKEYLERLDHVFYISYKGSKN